MPYTKNGTCIPYNEDDVTIPDSFKIDYRKELLINVEVTPADTPDKTAQRIDTVIQKLSELIYFPDETFGDICIERFSLQGTIHITSGSFTDDAAGLTAISHVFSILASKPVEHTKIGLTRHYHSFFFRCVDPACSWSWQQCFAFGTQISGFRSNAERRGCLIYAQTTSIL